MTIDTINKKTFELLDESRKMVASLVYTNASFDDAILSSSEKYLLNGITTGVWITHLIDDNSTRLQSKLRVETGGIITIRLPSKKSRYQFKKSTGWKLRFSLLNREGEDLLTLIPHINWQKESYDYVLQLNDAFETECDSFLILHTVHCANCSLSMMTGGPVPALISM